MAAQNKVIAGDYESKTVAISYNKESLGTAIIKLNSSASVLLDNSTVSSFEVVDETHIKNVA